MLETRINYGDFQADHSRWNTIQKPEHVHEMRYGHAFAALRGLDKAEQFQHWNEWEVKNNFPEKWIHIQKLSIIKNVANGYIPVEALEIANINILNEGTELIESGEVNQEQIITLYNDVISRVINGDLSLRSLNIFADQNDVYDYNPDEQVNGWRE